MENKSKFRPDLDLKLMDQVRQVLRYHHYAYRTENTYCDWIVRYIKYFGSKNHPRNMGYELLKRSFYPEKSHYRGDIGSIFDIISSNIK